MMLGFIGISRKAVSRVALSAEQIGERGRYPAIWHMNHLNAGHHLEQVASEMGGGSDITRRYGEFARIGLGMGDELRDRARWKREVRHHDFGHAGETCDRRDVAQEIEIEFAVKRRVNCVCCVN